jgi:pimeloyl-ACP methyl ester carboxylesterase
MFPERAALELVGLVVAGGWRQTPLVIPSDVFYARSGDVAIAYQVVGDGPVDMVFVRGFAGDVLSVWEQPLLGQFIEGLAAFSRVVVIDKRGTGLSDRVREVPTLETRMDDLRAVMDDLGSDQAILWTAQEGARLAALFAATHPERVVGLVCSTPRRRAGEASSIRGRGATKSGGCGCARSVTAGGAPSSSTPASRSGHQTSATIPLFAHGFSRTCGAA